MPAIIEVEHLTFHYPGARALDDVSFTIEADTVTALVGPNGAGKTTLLGCLAALTAGLAFGFGAAFLVYFATLGQVPPFDRGPNLNAMTVAVLGFMTRDLALVVYFYFSEKSERAGLTAVIYFGILYLLLPALARVLGLDSLLPWLLPTGGDSVLAGGVPAFVQAALVWLAVARKWRHRTDLGTRPAAAARA